jgi:diguanylate cyclase (GGDEF)-like protein/PAS domain S-box-containing protein
MSKKLTTQKQLLAENEDLRARFETAEQTLREILCGEADALFVSGVGGAQLFTLKGADQSYRTLVEDMSEGALTLTAEGVILYSNRRFAEMLKMSLEKVIGATIHTWIAPESQRIFQSLLSTGAGEKRREQLDLIASDGTRLPVYLSLSNLPIIGMPDAFCLVATDLSEQIRSAALLASEKSARESLAAANQARRALLSMIEDEKRAEARITYLNRVYAMLSGINTLIVRVCDRDELFREACRIAVEAGGFRMSMIANVDRSTLSIVPIASAGKDEGLLTAINSILSSSERAPTTLVAQAIREKKVIVSNDSQNDPRVELIKEYAESGVCSLAIFPLIVSDYVEGVLALYASEIDFFHEDEMKLLTELTGDISFALDNIDKRERLDYLAYYDALTGLANRNLFLDRVTQYMRSAVSGGHQLALYLIDLERFRNINYSLGQLAGDDLLKQVAEWLKRDVGDPNLLARLGADHFAVVLPEVRQEGDVARLLEKKMQVFQEHPFQLNDSVLRISFKAGVAIYPNDGADADTLFKKTEAALKKAKQSGNHYLFYTQKMTEASAGKLTLENQLRQALDKEEFVLHYQPKVNMASGKVTSAEGLIRWNDPQTGLVPPDRFIPILEETGMIYEVGRWALHKAISDYLRWRDAGLGVVRIAVNVSPLQLRHPEFIAEIERAIGVDEYAAAGLELEITESLIMEDVEHSIASLQVIRAMGINIAIDDFGTGFSSLSYLSRLPVDTLKIDRSFVIDMTSGPEGLTLVSTIINLAHSLKLKAVAEGVETEEQWRLLRLLNCDEIQGFLFSKPVPGEIFETRFLALPTAG